jgi:RNA polymerase sigma-70 factor, ECF subfamily
MPAPELAPQDSVASPEDYALVLEARRGAFDALDRLLVPRLTWALRLARKLTTSVSDAEDLLQEACLRVIEQLDRFPAGGRFDPWFARMIYNLAFNRQKAARVRAVEPLHEELVGTGDDPLQLAIAGETRAQLNHAVEQLPPRQKVIVMMFEIEGYPTNDIAAELGISTETVRWHLHAARKTLRAALHGTRVIDETAMEDA